MWLPLVRAPHVRRTWRQEEKNRPGGQAAPDQRSPIKPFEDEESFFGHKRVESNVQAIKQTSGAEGCSLRGGCSFTD